MDIAEAVTNEYVEIEPDTRVAKVAGAFENPSIKAVVVADDGAFQGVITHRQLLSSHHDPDEKAISAMRRDPPRLQHTDNVREVARLMLESQLKLLPVFEGTQFRGVVTAASILSMVEPNLGVLTIDDVYTRELLAIEPDTTIGEAIHTVLAEDISRLPVLSGGAPVGMVSLHDLVGFTVRKMQKSTGGSAGGFDEHGGEGSSPGFRTHGGFGAREGEQARMLDLPVSDVMTPGVLNTRSNVQLDDAVGKMLENDYSSLVVVSEDETALGIVTDSDVLRSLTWTGEGRMDFQIFGIDLLDDITREEIAELIQRTTAKYSDLDVLETNVVFHEHKEKTRGTPLIQAKVRLFTDEGRFIASGEEYGAGPAYRSAIQKLEREVLNEKEYARTKKHTPEKRERVENLMRWWLEI